MMKRRKSGSKGSQRRAAIERSDAASERSLAAAVDELHLAFIARNDILMRAVSDLTTAVTALCRSRDKPPIRAIKFADYTELKTELKKVVNQVLPERAVVAVVSKGDDDLLDLNGRLAYHFPQAADGRYAGYYPSNSAEAIHQLETLRARGTQYLVFQRASYWWFDYYSGLKRFLADQCRKVPSPPDICRIYQFDDVPASLSATHVPAYLSHPGKQLQLEQIRATVTRSLPADAVIAVVSKGEKELLDLGGRAASHFAQDTAGRPVDLTAATNSEVLAQLELRCSEGAQFLLLPSNSLWWLNFYPQLKVHLDELCRLVIEEPGVCMIWDIRGKRSGPLRSQLRSGKAVAKGKTHHER